MIMTFRNSLNRNYELGDAIDEKSVSSTLESLLSISRCCYTYLLKKSLDGTCRTIVLLINLDTLDDASLSVSLLKNKAAKLSMDIWHCG